MMQLSSSLLFKIERRKPLCMDRMVWGMDTIAGRVWTQWYGVWTQSNIQARKKPVGGSERALLRRKHDDRREKGRENPTISWWLQTERTAEAVKLISECPHPLVEVVHDAFFLFGLKHHLDFFPGQQGGLIDVDVEDVDVRHGDVVSVLL